jgi:hypothetical protein
MMYGIIRIVFWGSFAVLTLFFIKKRNLNKEKLAVILTIVLSMILCSASFLFPIENTIISFKTPQDVFNYIRRGKVDDIIHGETSGMVIYSKGKNSGGYIIIPETAKGYKIPSLHSVKKVSNKLDQNGSFVVYNVAGTNDYYVVGTIILKGGEISVIDSNNSLVKNIIIEMGNTDKKTVLVFSFVESFTNEYYLLIGGEKVFVSN